MNMIYNSPSYCVLEFEVKEDFEGRLSGFEIVDKTGQREIYIGGVMAERFRSDVAELVAGENSMEDMDDYLRRFDHFMQQRLVVH